MRAKTNETIREIQKEIISKLNNGNKEVVVSLYDLVMKHGFGTTIAYTALRILRQWGESLGLNVKLKNGKLIFSKENVEENII